MLRSREAGLPRLRGGIGTCRHPQPMRSASSGSRAAVWRFCARPGLLVLRVWPGGSDRAGWCRLGLGGGDGGIGSNRERGGLPARGHERGGDPEPWRVGGVRLLCGARAEPWLLSLFPGDAAWLGRGCDQRWALAPGCEHGDNRRREPSSASTARRARLFRGPHCLKESEAGGARAPEGRRPPGLPGLRGGGPGQLWALRQ